MTIPRARATLAYMKTPEDVNTTIEANEFARFRLGQLEALLDRTRDWSIPWTDIRFAKILEDSKLIELLRGNAVLTLRQEIIEMGCEAEVNSILKPQLPAKIYKLI